MSTDANSRPEAPDPRFPIGRFARPAIGEALPEDLLEGALRDLSELPENLRNALHGLDAAQLDTPYREGGWTVRQLTHHVADSHMNAFLRVKKALTEDAPLIMEYDEKHWAELPDTVAPVEWSLELIESLHARWVLLLQALNAAEWQRTFVHPVHGPQTVEFATLLYAWHSRHHLSHVTHLRRAHGW